MMIVSFSWIMKISWNVHEQRKESYDTKKKNFFYEQERTTCSRTTECEWFVDDYDRKTMNSSDNRWCSEEFDRSVDVITCWRISQEFFVQYAIVINSEVLSDGRRLSNYRMLSLWEMKRSVFSFISICSSWSSLSWVTRGYSLNSECMSAMRKADDSHANFREIALKVDSLNCSDAHTAATRIVWDAV
jgi:hypothetical protein